MAIKTTLTNWAGRLAAVKDALGGLHGGDSGIRAECGNLLAQRVALINLRPPKQDLVREVEQHVDAIATKWSADHGAAIVAAVAGSMDVAISGEVRGVQRGDLLSAFPGHLTISDAIALCPASVKARLVAAIESTTYEAGPPLAERPALIAKLDERIAALEREHAELVDAASESGITLQHMENERARRSLAAHRAEYLAREERDRRPRGDRG